MPEGASWEDVQPRELAGTCPHTMHASLRLVVAQVALLLALLAEAALLLPLLLAGLGQLRGGGVGGKGCVS